MYSEKLPHDNPCPRCGINTDGVSSSDNVSVKPGDLSVCIYCATILQFDENLKSQLMSKDEFEQLPADFKEQVLQIVDGIKQTEHFNNGGFDA